MGKFNPDILFIILVVILLVGLVALSVTGHANVAYEYPPNDAYGGPGGVPGRRWVNSGDGQVRNHPWGNGENLTPAECAAIGGKRTGAGLCFCPAGKTGTTCGIEVGDSNYTGFLIKNFLSAKLVDLPTANFLSFDKSGVSDLATCATAMVSTMIDVHGVYIETDQQGNKHYYGVALQEDVSQHRVIMVDHLNVTPEANVHFKNESIYAGIIADPNVTLINQVMIKNNWEENAYYYLFNATETSLRLPLNTIVNVDRSARINDRFERFDVYGILLVTASNFSMQEVGGLTAVELVDAVRHGLFASQLKEITEDTFLTLATETNPIYIPPSIQNLRVIYAVDY